MSYVITFDVTYMVCLFCGDNSGGGVASATPFGAGEWEKYKLSATLQDTPGPTNTSFLSFSCDHQPASRGWRKLPDAPAKSKYLPVNEWLMDNMRLTNIDRVAF
jgi:hypothetical protein